MVTRVPMTVAGAERLREEVEHLKRVERPRKSGLRYTVTSASPNRRIDEMRSFRPSGIWSHSSPAWTQK